VPLVAWWPQRPESARLKRILQASLVAWLALPAVTFGADGAKNSAHPLLDLARELELTRDRKPKAAPGTSALPDIQHQIRQAGAPADEACAQSIGAARYAALYLEAGAARSGEGDFTGAAAEYRRAHACRPRDAFILAALAGVLFDLRDFAGAREAINASLAIDPRDVNANRLAGNLDYVEERWADAIARYRYVASSDPDRNQAGYGQLMFWLAQRRAGVAKPEFVVRTPGEGWPQPLLLYMRGQYTEAELITPIKEGDSEANSQPNTNTDERLCEALFYVGEEYWARGQSEVARDYLAALVNIKVLFFIEHGLALAEIAKLQ
jgi:lipoprotein NlpI